jgi:hypothetical protein
VHDCQTYSRTDHIFHAEANEFNSGNAIRYVESNYAHM